MSSANVVALDQPAPIMRKITMPTPGGKPTKYTVKVEHKEDPKEALIKRIGTLPADFVQFNNILVAIYMPPIVTSVGGILLPGQISEQDVEDYKWQGKVGLIVAMGPEAYVDDEVTKFKGTKNNIGDWVWFKASDGWANEVNGVFCRLFKEADIVGRIPHPDAVW